MLIQGLGCDFQNEAAIMASIQMQLDLTFHARRELPFQVPANQMDGVPTVHTCPTSSGPAWVGPFSSPQHAIRPGKKLFKFEHSGLALAPACLRRPQPVIPSEAGRHFFFLARSCEPVRRDKAYRKQPVWPLRESHATLLHESNPHPRSVYSLPPSRHVAHVLARRPHQIS